MTAVKVDYEWQYDEDKVFETGIVGHTVVHDYFVLDNNGKLTLKKGYAWNGATAAIDTDSFIDPSAVHDAFYQMIKEKLVPESVRLKADLLLRKMCIEKGMLRLRAEYVFLMVRAFGGKFAR